MEGGATGHDGRAVADFGAWQFFTVLAYKPPPSNQHCQFLTLMSIIKAHLIIPERIICGFSPHIQNLWQSGNELGKCTQERKSYLKVACLWQQTTYLAPRPELILMFFQALNIELWGYSPSSLSYAHLHVLYGTPSSLEMLLVTEKGQKKQPSGTKETSVFPLHCARQTVNLCFSFESHTSQCNLLQISKKILSVAFSVLPSGCRGPWGKVLSS